MEFVEATAFTRNYSKCLTDDDYRELQNHLASEPEIGDVMPRTGGFRKVRWSDPKRGKGRRGGLRVIYFYFADEHQIWLMTLYGKNEASDLTPKEKQTLKSALDNELRARQTARLARQRRLRR
ncbi:MAG: hypothetical protein WAN14_17100 [Candidatus Acidiferrales bacterium]